MKLFFSILSLLFLSIMTLKTQPRSPEEEAFYNNNYQAYNSYATELEYETNGYSILVLVGDYEAKVSYSIFFELKDADNYKLYIKQASQEGYYPSVNSKGGSTVYNLSSTEVITIEIHQENVPTYLYELKPLDINNYQETYKDKIIQGNNLGFSEIEDLNNKDSKTPKLTIILSSVFLGIILISITILLIMFALKKGIFNQEVLDKEFEEEHNIRNQINDYLSNLDEENIEVEAEEIKSDQTNNQETKEVYKKYNNYDFDEARDIAFLLQEKGYNTNYSELSNDEKNNVMLELMKMRHMKEITDEEYRSEVIKLWM